MELRHSDLALECCVDRGVEGVAMRQREVEGHEVLHVQIKTAAAAAAVGKPCGRYVTVKRPSGRQALFGESAATARIVGVELRDMAERMTGKRITTAFSLLAVGLGNAEITPDALGPATVRRLPITRSREKGRQPLVGELCRIAALAPGVTAATGLKTSEVLGGVIQATKPDLVLVIDALAARETAHLHTTVQLSDTGILPGSGVRRCGEALNAANLGVPVLSLGVPTVVGSETLVLDALLRCGIEYGDEALAALLQGGRGFLVTPTEIDLLIPLLSDLLAEAIGRAFAVT